jgi:arsenite methyltransferase
MHELGYDLNQHSSKGLSAVPAVEYDVVVTLGCEDTCHVVRAKHREDWSIPVTKEMSPDQFRKVRDDIGKVKDLLTRLCSKGATMHETPEQLRSTVQERFAKVARTPHENHPFPVGPESAKALGYDAAEIDALAPRLTESFAGVGNPIALGELRAGDTVLDLGSGAGMDSILAARRVRPTGKVIGVDMTAEMVEKARANAAAVGVTNAEFHQADADSLPPGDKTVDVVISNGVFNLCLDKPKVLAEVFRVLKPGGRIQMADILLHDNVTPQEVASKGAWSD